jgi:hypothetical protein
MELGRFFVLSWGEQLTATVARGAAAIRHLGLVDCKEHGGGRGLWYVWMWMDWEWCPDWGGRECL